MKNTYTLAEIAYALPYDLDYEILIRDDDCPVVIPRMKWRDMVDTLKNEWWGSHTKLSNISYFERGEERPYALIGLTRV